MKLIEHIVKYCIKKLTKNNDQSIVLALSQGLIASRVLTLAKQLDLHTHLRDGSLSLEALAERTQTHSPTLRRFLDTMASLGIVEKQGDSRYAKTGVTEQLDLLTESFSGDMAYHAWDAMRHTLKTGEPGWNKVHGASFYAVLNKNPTLSAEFDQWNEKTCDLWLSPVVSQYDFSKFKTLADLGGGKGQFLTQVLQANPGMSGILFDRPIVTKLAESFLKERKFSKHCKVIGGSLLDSKFPVADLYSICRVLLNMNDAGIEECQSCHEARVKVIDHRCYIRR